MMAQIPENHPLSRMFRSLTEQNFCEKLGLCDTQITSYVSDVLLRFCRTENLYRIRDTKGRALEDVGEMLLESNPLLESASFEREREVRKHIGDYTLFFTGMFPESLKRRPRTLRLDYFIDYIEAGKESYSIVSTFDYGDYREAASLFRRLSEQFDYCVVGLNFVRADLDKLQNQSFQRVKSIIAE